MKNFKTFKKTFKEYFEGYENNKNIYEIIDLTIATNELCWMYFYEKNDYLFDFYRGKYYEIMDFVNSTNNFTKEQKILFFKEID